MSHFYKTCKRYDIISQSPRNFQSLEAVDRSGENQLQVTENDYFLSQRF